MTRIRPYRKDQVTRLRIGHTNWTYSYYINRTDPNTCDFFKLHLTITCSKYNIKKVQHDSTNSLVSWHLRCFLRAVFSYRRNRKFVGLRRTRSDLQKFEKKESNFSFSLRFAKEGFIEKQPSRSMLKQRLRSLKRDCVDCRTISFSRNYGCSSVDNFSLEI